MSNNEQISTTNDNQQSTDYNSHQLATTNSNVTSLVYKPESLKLPSNETTPNKMDNDHDMATRCGLWVWHPDFVQPFARVGAFTAFISVAGLMTQTLVNYVNSQVTTLERQFGFSSQQTGIILAANDIGYLVCVLFVGYLATRTHIPRSLGVAAIIYGVSGIACALPHFLFGAHVNADRASENSSNTSSDVKQQSSIFGRLCDVNNSWIPCANSSASKRVDLASVVASEKFAEISLVIIVIGMALQGFGKAPRTSFIVTYLDDNTAKHNTGFYMGIVMATTLLGPAVAYLMGGVFSRMYVTLEATKLTPRHPKWIGAWWLGYVVFGVMSLVVAVPLFCFPRRLPRNKAKVTHADDETTAGTNKLPFSHLSVQKAAPVDPRKNYTASLRSNLKFVWRHSREFLASMYRLLTNPVFVCMTMASCCTIFSLAGAAAFSPKYLESMFHLPAHNANFVMAVQTLCTACAGSFLGGYFSRRLRMTAMTAIYFILVAISVCLLAQLLGFIFGCEQANVHNQPSEESSCNRGCNCRDNSYFPICGDDGRTYYSPCHAGCLLAEHGVYQNCSCIPGGSARSGTCDYTCSDLYIYAVLMGIRLLTNTLTIIPKTIVVIRSVSEKDKAMALSVMPFLIALLGWLLSPIVFGNAIDSTCQIWDIKCQKTGRCLLYDNNSFRVKLHGYGTLGISLGLVFLVLTYLFARYTKCLHKAAKNDVLPDKTAMALINVEYNAEKNLPVSDTEENNSQSNGETKQKQNINK